MAETAIREALREAVRDALHDVSLERDATAVTASLPKPAKVPVGADFGNVSDEEAWERFDSIRFARLAGMSHESAS